MLADASCGEFCRLNASDQSRSAITHGQRPDHRFFLLCEKAHLRDLPQLSMARLLPHSVQETDETPR
jgi:hypothetical protein